MVVCCSRFGMVGCMWLRPCTPTLHTCKWAGGFYSILLTSATQYPLFWFLSFLPSGCAGGQWHGALMCQVIQTHACPHRLHRHCMRSDRFYLAATKNWQRVCSAFVLSPVIACVCLRASARVPVDGSQSEGRRNEAAPGNFSLARWRSYGTEVPEKCKECC